MKDAATRSYAKKGDDVVKMNHDAIDAGATAYVKVDVPESWKNCTDDDYSVEVKETTRKLLTSLRIFSRKSTDSRVTQFLYLLLRNTRQAGLHPVQQHTRSVVLQQTFLYGMLPSVSSVTSVLMYVLMQQSVQSL